MNNFNKEHAYWQFIYHNINEIGYVNKEDMKNIEKEVLKNSFYKDDEKYDIVIDEIISRTMDKYPIEKFLEKYPDQDSWNNELVKDIENKFNATYKLSAKEYFNKLSN